MGLLDKLRRRKEKWHIIDNMHELPIGKYLRILEIGKREAEEIDKSTAILQVLTDWSATDLECLSLNEYSALVSGCGWLFEQPKPTKIQRTYKIGDFELRLTDAKDICTAQYIDFQAYAKDMDSYIVELLSALLVPKGKRYGEGYDIERLRKHIAQYMPTDTAMTLVGFFLNNAQQSIGNILHSLEQTINEAPAKTIEQMQTKARAMAVAQHLRKNGGGI